MTHFKLEIDQSANSERNLEKTVALELAIGVSLPKRIDDWPIGLTTEWNRAATHGAFENTHTIGDMARGFLAYRTRQLSK